MRLALLLFVSVFSGMSAAFAEDDAAMAKKKAAEIGLQPGMTLDQSTAGLAKGLLPPELLQHFEKGEFKNKIASNYPADGGTHGPEFDAQSKKNATTLDVDKNGTIIDKSSGKQPDYIYGTPFPNIDAKDPNGAVKVL